MAFSLAIEKEHDRHDGAASGIFKPSAPKRQPCVSAGQVMRPDRTGRSPVRAAIALVPSAIANPVGAATPRHHQQAANTLSRGNAPHDPRGSGNAATPAASRQHPLSSQCPPTSPPVGAATPRRHQQAAIIPCRANAPHEPSCGSGNAATPAPKPPTSSIEPKPPTIPVGAATPRRQRPSRQHPLSRQSSTHQPPRRQRPPATPLAPRSRKPRRALLGLPKMFRYHPPSPRQPRLATFPRAPLAQLVEHRTFNPRVVGSNPTRRTIHR